MRYVLSALAATLASCGTTEPVADACPSDPELKLAAVFDYSDFGPDIIATEALGRAWYQWLDYGGGNPAAEFDVKAVVHADGARGEAESAYPVVEAEMRDYRYMGYGEAVSFLDAALADVAEAEADSVPMAGTAAMLTATRERIVGEVCPSVGGG